jgi:steroid delta-isomerase-like uncharacterized protein
MRARWVWSLALLLGGCQVPVPSVGGRTSGKAVVQGYVENILNTGHWEMYDQFFGPQVEFNGALVGRAELERRVNSFRSAYPDFKVQIEEQIAEGDLVVTRLTCTGTQLGTDLGVPATGVHVRFSGIAIDRIKDGKIVQMRFLGDVWSRMQQIRNDL